MITYGIFSYEEIRPILGHKKSRYMKIQRSKWARVSSRRMKVFKRNNKCAHCGKKGNIFLLQKDDSKSKHCHLKLYHLDKNGGKTLMTTDHIIPLAKGGADKICNLQTLCNDCNQIKAHKIIEKDFKRLNIFGKICDRKKMKIYVITKDAILSMGKVQTYVANKILAVC